MSKREEPGSFLKLASTSSSPLLERAVTRTFELAAKGKKVIVDVDDAARVYYIRRMPILAGGTEATP